MELPSTEIDLLFTCLANCIDVMGIDGEIHIHVMFAYCYVINIYITVYVYTYTIYIQERPVLYSLNVVASIQTGGIYLLHKHRVTWIEIHIINQRRSNDRPRFIIGIPISIRRCLPSEYKPRPPR